VRKSQTASNLAEVRVKAVPVPVARHKDRVSTAASAHTADRVSLADRVSQVAAVSMDLVSTQALACTADRVRTDMRSRITVIIIAGRISSPTTAGTVIAGMLNADMVMADMGITANSRTADIIVMGTTGIMDNMPAAIAVMDCTGTTVNSRVAVDITGTATTASTRIAGMATMGITVNTACTGIADRTNLLIADHTMVGTTPVPVGRITAGSSSPTTDRKAHRHPIAADRPPSGLAVSADRARVGPPRDRTHSYAASHSAGPTGRDRMGLRREDRAA